MAKTPKLSEGQLPVRFKPEEEQYLRQRAAVEDRSVSSLVRLLVRAAMQSEQQQQPHQAA
jgi:plasmid stability protein